MSGEAGAKPDRIEPWDNVRFGTLLPNGTLNGLYKASSFYGSGTAMFDMGDIFRSDVVQHKERRRVRLAADECAKFQLREGDLLFARRSLQLSGAGKCALVPALPEYPVCESSIIRARMDLTRCCPAFYLQFWNGLVGFQLRMSIARQVAVSGISAGDLVELLVPIPPLGEQRKIAAILFSVDEAIEGTQVVIDQLQVVKKAMMADLLTRGIPGRHKKFKQTEIGEVPEDWQVVPLSEVANLQTGVAKGKNPADAVELPYLRVANVQDGYVDLSEMKTILVERNAIGRYQLKAGDVLFTEGGDADKLGRGCVWQAQISPCLHQNHVFAVRPNPERLLSQYLAYAAASPRGKQYFLDCAKQTTNLASINSTQLKALPIPLASIEEQSAIVAAISSVDARLSAEVSDLESIRSAKQSLMSVLLTGEVRVRGDDEAARD